MSFKYPQSPKSVPPELTRISAAYKKGVSLSIWSFVVFFVLYAGLIALNIVGIFWAAKLPGLISLFCIVVLIMIFILQIYFLIRSKKKDDGIDIEITKEDQPDIFLFIDKLCKEIGSPHPGKVVITGRNNASVFQSLGFWRLIIPPKKNLEIGLALVFSIDVSELKAILAHELGHFSQSSTRVGGYIYSANEVVGRMVFSREIWEGSFSAFAQMNIVFYAIARVAYEFSRIQKKLFVSVYNYMNKSYMKLSREMEFHADAVAVSVSGSSSIISGLRRSEFADSCIKAFDYYIAKYEETENRTPKNYFILYRHFSKIFSEQNQLKLDPGGLVIINKTEMSDLFSERKLVYKNLWESHPSLEEREKNASRIHIESDLDSTPAIELFRDWEKLTDALTLKLHETHHKNRTSPLEIVSADECGIRMKEMFLKEFISERFKGLYDMRIVPALDFGELAYRDFTLSDFESVIGHAEKETADELKMLHMDITEITAIGSKQLDVNVFEYDKKKYRWKEAPGLIVELNEKYEKCAEVLKQKDEEVFLFHFTLSRKLALPEHSELISACTLHKQIFNCVNDLDEIFKALLPSIENIQNRGDILRTEQHEFMPAYTKAIESFQQAVFAMERISFPSAIGEVKLNKGILSFVWEGDLPDFSVRSFKMEMLIDFWPKLISALHKFNIIQFESHFTIIHIYEKIFKAQTHN
jgi:hypothetical protein